jgi:hypothetical protein
MLSGETSTFGRWRSASQRLADLHQRKVVCGLRRNSHRKTGQRIFFSFKLATWLVTEDYSNIPWKLRNSITVNVIIRLTWSKWWKSQFACYLHIVCVSALAYCYHLVIVISLAWFQRNHIKLNLLVKHIWEFRSLIFV